MIMKRIATGALLVALASSTAFAQTGRQLQVTTPLVDNGDGTGSQTIIDAFWDARCAGNIKVTLNSSVLPNETLAAGTISAEDTAAAIDAGLQRWTDNPSSFIDMEVAATADLPSLFTGRPLFDFVNESQFELPFTAIGFPAGVLAVSLSTELIADATFTPGDDIDGDGDSDVFDPEAEGLNVCTDIDGDGDTDYPAGDYAAGTILDNDVLFNQLVTWETTPTAGGGADIDAVSTHEYGHSHGLTHSTINQISATDGTSATMFPSISTGDPASEEGTRTPSSDDLAASAFIYPEGSGTGAAALQAGDVAFGSAFGIIEGEVTNAAGEPILGAAVSAVNRDGEVVAVTFSGEVATQTIDLATGATLGIDIDNGHYSLAVPSREIYTIHLEALDGPVLPTQIKTETVLAGAFSTTTFPEEAFDAQESNVEFRQTFTLPVHAVPARFGTKATRGGRRTIDFVLNEEGSIENVPSAGLSASIPTILGASTSFQFIEQFDRNAILASLIDGDFLVGVNIGTGTALSSAVPAFSSFELVTGRIDPETGVVTLGEEEFFTEFETVIGQDGDLTPLNFRNPRLASLRLGRMLADDPSLELFLVASVDDIPAVTAPLGAVIPFVRPIITGPDNGTSFLTIDGSPILSTSGIFTVPVNWDMQVRTATPVRGLPARFFTE